MQPLALVVSNLPVMSLAVTMQGVNGPSPRARDMPDDRPAAFRLETLEDLSDSVGQFG